MLSPRRRDAMPELPDVTVYVERLNALLAGRTLERLRILGPAVLKTVEPKPADCGGRIVVGFSRLGKRVVFELEGDLFVVVHLMVAGRFHWKKAGATPPRKTGHASFDFAHGSMHLTEQGTKKRARIHLVAGRAGLADHDPGGVEPLECTLADFAAALRRESHTLKRSLTAPHLVSGIGNAYSDEILHAARLSPVQLTKNLDDAAIERLFAATRDTLTAWTERLRQDVGDGFPEKVTAFRPEMAVHGRFGEPCPVCGTKVQRIVRAENEVNYCPTCQTGGKLLADRALSRLLKQDWPKTLEEWEARKEERSA
jgi:formamidopyrimidine-DNA glycosylase